MKGPFIGWTRAVKKISAALLFVVAAIVAAAEAGAIDNKAPSIRFRFRPEAVDNVHGFHVEVRFRVHDAVTRVVVPTAFGGATHLETEIQNLKVSTPGAALEDGPTAGSKQLKARAGEQVDLEYDLVPGQPAKFRHPAEHRAVVNADYFLFNTSNALIHPVVAPNAMATATFDWRALPKGMPLVTSFGIDKRVIRVHAPWFRIGDALFAGGSFRVTESRENGTTLVFAAQGQWRFTDAEAFAEIRKVIDAENRFWHAEPMHYFLVTLAQFDQDTGSQDGSGFTNAYMLFLSRQDTFNMETVQLLAHEMFHHWNPLAMGPPASDEVAEWFTEGFTVYYAGVIPLRAGLTSYEDYLVYLNRWLRRYQFSPMRNFTQAQWEPVVPHTSGPAYELPYSRGAAVALWADAEIRATSGGEASLDDVMYELMNQAQPAENPPPLTEERVFDAFAHFLSAEELTQLRQIVIDGAEVPLPQAIGNCAHLERVTQSVVDPGFDEKSLENKRIAGVDPNGPAYRAGIRDGQEVFRYSIYRDDPTKPVVLGVVVDGQRKTVQFSAAMPREVEQYRLTAEASAMQTCSPF